MDTHEIMDLSKPTSKISFNSMKESAIKNKSLEKNLEIDKKTKPRVSLLEFIRMYTVSNIPVMDFVIIYIILYSLNCLYLECDFKIVLVGTIPLTIFLNMLFNDKFIESVGVIIVFTLSLVGTIYASI